jgi:hypothetical protein
VNDAGPARRARNPYLRLLGVLGASWLVLALSTRLASAWRPGGGEGVRLPDASAFEPVPAAQGSAIEEPRRVDEEPQAVREALDRRPQRILLFGDSMVPVLAPRLADYCLANGHELYPAVWYGSTIIYWAWQERLAQLLAELRPTMVIAVLGSSELAVRDVGECEPYVEAIIRRVGARKLVWVGPPNWREDTGVNALLERTLGRSRFFRSGQLELERRADGIHPTESAGAAWADDLARWIETDSAAPIALSRPTRRAPPVRSRVYPPPF